MRKLFCIVCILIMYNAVFGQTMYSKVNIKYPNRGLPNVFWDIDYIKANRISVIEEYSSKDSLDNGRKFETSYFDITTGHLLKTVNALSMDSIVYYWSGVFFSGYNKYDQGKVSKSCRLHYEFPYLIFSYNNSTKSVFIFGLDSTLLKMENYDKSGILHSQKKYIQLQNLEETIFDDSVNRIVSRCYSIDELNLLSVIVDQNDKISLIENVALNKLGYFKRITRYSDGIFSSSLFKYNKDDILTNIELEENGEMSYTFFKTWQLK